MLLPGAAGSAQSFSATTHMPTHREGVFSGGCHVGMGGVELGRR